uniref:Uncharacterized protein n=1 Tax=viral metagenome TaxID=1070528 RepID=A0A6C0EJE7_9ZZZZ
MYYKLIFYFIVILFLYMVLNIDGLQGGYIGGLRGGLMNNSHYINFGESNLVLMNIYGDYINHYRNKNEIYIKTGILDYNLDGKNLDNKKIVDYYIKNTLKFSKNDKKALYFYVDTIREKYSTYRLITHSNWNFIKISHTLEKSMPFTLDNYIFLSDKVLKDFYNMMVYNKNTMILQNCETLIHEKIHIIQRNNQSLFNTLYINHFNSIYCNHLIITNYWNTKIMTNPDGLEIKWIYKLNNKYYLPLLITNKDNIEEVVITLKWENNTFITTREFIEINSFPLFNYLPSNISYSHPNEISAYIISNYIVDKSSLNISTKKIVKYYLNVFK